MVNHQTNNSSSSRIPSFDGWSLTLYSQNLIFVLCERTWDWSALILGTRSVNDILTEKGKAILHVLFALVGILLLLGVFSLVGGILYGILYALTYAFQIKLSTLTLSNGQTLVSTLSTVLSILTAVGLSLSLVAQKAWNSHEIFRTMARSTVGERP